MTLRLVIEHSPVPQPRPELRHDGGELTIGRGADCDWRIEDPEQVISRRHCVISGGAGRWTVTDMSSGGLYIDGSGRPLGPGNSAPVENGTRLRLGDVLLRAELIDARAPASADTAAKPAAADDFFAPRAAPPPPPARPDSLPPPFEGERRPFSEPVRTDGSPPQFDDPFSLGADDLRPRGALVEPTPPQGTPKADPFGFDVTFEGGVRPPSGGSRGTAEDDWGFGLGPVGGDERADPPKPAEPAADAFGDWGLGTLSRSPTGSGAVPAPRADAAGTTDDLTPDGSLADPFGLGGGARIRVRNPDIADATLGTPHAGAGKETAATPTAAPSPNTPATPDPSPAAAQGPAPPPPPPQPTATADTTPDLVAAFLRGAGIEATATPADMEALGRRFRALAEGLILLLRTRAQEKNSVRVAQTVFGARDVNPLKVAVTPEEGTAALVAHRGKGYLDPDAAIEAAFRDLTDHQLRTWTGLQTALRRMIDRFDPALFEAEVEDVGMLKSLIAGSRPARLWQLYTERYRDIATAAEGRFLGEVGADFRDAYEGSKGEGQ